MQKYTAIHASIPMQDTFPITALYRYQPPYRRFHGICFPNLCHDSTSRLILAVQEGKDFAIQEFARQLDKLIPADAVICCIPGGYRASYSKQGIEKIARCLAVLHQRVDGLHILHRTGYGLKDDFDIFRQTLRFHLDTIEIIDPNQVKNRTVVLLDDITRSGNSLKAGSLLLNAAGAQKVLPYALGQA